MRIDQPQSIIVFRNGSIGNTLVALPAIKAIKEHFPRVKLSVVLDNLGAELLKYCSFIDTIIPYDKHDADRGLSAHLKLIGRLRKQHPTHAILFKRFFRNGLLSYLSGAEYRIGFATQGKAPFLNRTIPYDETIHIAQLNLKLLSLVGIETELKPYSLTLSDKDKNDAQQVLQEAGIAESRFVVVHYGGATTQPDFFPVARLRQLLQLVSKADLEIALIGAGQSEEQLARETIEKTETGKLLMNLPVRVMAAVIEKANCFIGFNSGPAHVAAGVKTPGIVFYRPDENTQNEIRKWQPLFEKLLPSVPPAVDDDSEWSEYVENTHLSIVDLLSVDQNAR